MEALELFKFRGRHDGDEMSCGERRRRREDEARFSDAKRSGQRRKVCAVWRR